MYTIGKLSIEQIKDEETPYEEIIEDIRYYCIAYKELINTIE